ncbi:hypothetical protein VP01_5990g1 [Puccinia sorghi]|uniref:Uncharacterized protein n=1 Tax=Puccinia sorghi TaxID=27349 RepID=A0A0L6UHH1_9BASI|nr:hypothetical protein VP01_5990g1 [Puccinia sorghi]
MAMPHLQTSGHPQMLQSKKPHCSRIAGSGTSNIQFAMSLYQEVHASDTSTEESLAAFKILLGDIKAVDPI